MPNLTTLFENQLELAKQNPLIKPTDQAMLFFMDVTDPCNFRFLKVRADDLHTLAESWYAAPDQPDLKFPRLIKKDGTL